MITKQIQVRAMTVTEREEYTRLTDPILDVYLSVEVEERPLAMEVLTSSIKRVRDSLRLILVDGRLKKIV